MRKVGLVFRTIGERTSEMALELAREHIRPDEELILDNCRPFTKTVQRMVHHDWSKVDYIVAVDADSLILEDMRPFLDVCDRPYVDCYVYDRFRGRLHCGVHITRRDIMEKMAEIPPPDDDEAYVLRPESRLRKLALNDLGELKCFKGFRILHDHLQWLRDVWAKYALRELRSRTSSRRARRRASWRTRSRGSPISARSTSPSSGSRSGPRSRAPRSTPTPPSTPRAGRRATTSTRSSVSA